MTKACVMQKLFEKLIVHKSAYMHSKTLYRIIELQNSVVLLKLNSWVHIKDTFSESALFANVLFNPVALRKAKTPSSFGHSECNRVKPQSFGHSECNRVKQPLLT